MGWDKAENTTPSKSLQCAFYTLGAESGQIPAVSGTRDALLVREFSPAYHLAAHEKHGKSFAKHRITRQKHTSAWIVAGHLLSASTHGEQRPTT